jgi:nitrite reductase/ring-hydroxylating ferredoxin subunit
LTLVLVAAALILAAIFGGNWQAAWWAPRPGELPPGPLLEPALARGKLLEDCKVQCPLHRARFDIRTGAVLDWANFPPGIQLLNVVRGEKALQTYKVSVKSGQVRVSVPEA